MQWCFRFFGSKAATTSQPVFTVGFTLGTGIVLGTLKPYRQRQVRGDGGLGCSESGVLFKMVLELGHEKDLE